MIFQNIDNVLDVAARVLTAPYEGCVLTPYQDPHGIWTYGYGSTTDLYSNPVLPTTPPLTQEQALWLLKTEMTAAAQAVETNVSVPLNVNQAAALTDFVFNCGAYAFEESTLLQMLNAGEYVDAANQFARWDHAGNVQLAGLERRCMARGVLFLTQTDVRA